MYQTLTVPADNETTAEKEVNKLFNRLGLFTWQIKGFGPVHDKESDFIPGTPQYKVIVLLTADQVEKFSVSINSSEYIKSIQKNIIGPIKKPAGLAKKPAAKKPAAKKAAAKKAAALAKKPADPVKEKPVK